MKVIGIPGYNNADGGSFGVGKTYLHFISHFGVPRIIMPHEEFVSVDMLLLTGGLDINPTCYGELPSFYTSNQDVFKQFFFDKRLDNYVGKTPILGICLGAQQLNVKFGGKLTQNITETVLRDDSIMSHAQSPDRRTEAHKAIPYMKTGFIRDNPQFQIKPFDVNSHHHQGVVFQNGDLAHPLVPIATSADGVVEAFAHKTMPIIGIQWHPEEWYDPFSMEAIKYLLK